MIRAYVALGSNLGSPMQTIEDAIDTLTSLRGSLLMGMSSLFRTAPVGLKHQADFINAVVALDTRLTARELLDELFAIEASFGRIREPGSVKNAPRTLDLDLLLHGDQVLDDPVLTLPHPRMHERAFVLAPLAEIAPDLVVPGRGPVATLLAACADQRIHPLIRE